MATCVLIDGDGAERGRIRVMLERLGLRCTEFATAEEGIAHCLSDCPDVVMIDASRLTAAREFLMHARHVKRQHRNSEEGHPVIILYAAHGKMDVMGESILEGASEFLLKPFDHRLLRFKLRQAGIGLETAA